jgi:hypothetical protein
MPRPVEEGEKCVGWIGREQVLLLTHGQDGNYDRAPTRLGDDGRWRFAIK